MHFFEERCSLDVEFLDVFLHLNKRLLIGSKEVARAGEKVRVKQFVHSQRAVGEGKAGDSVESSELALAHFEARLGESPHRIFAGIVLDRGAEIGENLTDRGGVDAGQGEKALQLEPGGFETKLVREARKFGSGDLVGAVVVFFVGLEGGGATVAEVDGIVSSKVDGFDDVINDGTAHLERMSGNTAKLKVENLTLRFMEFGSFGI